MAEFPAEGYLESGDRTVDEIKQALEDWNAACKQVAGGPYAGDLTIVSGAITATGYFHRVATEGGAASDYLDAINSSIPNGHLLLIARRYADRTVIVRHHQASPYIDLEGGGTFELDDGSRGLLLVKLSGSTWREIGRCYGQESGWQTAYREHLGAFASSGGTLTGDVMIQAYNTLLLPNTNAVGLTSESNALQIGEHGVGSESLAVGFHNTHPALQARNGAGSSAALNLNPLGGGIYAGSNLIWHAGNDGAGSGLDADKLDGEHGSAIKDLPYLKAWDIKSQNTNGGGFTFGAWRTRDLSNTPATNTISGASISGNLITLPSGTYRSFIRCPAYRVARHMARLYNVTDGGVALLGCNACAGNNDATQTDSFVQGRFVISGAKQMRIEHRCSVTAAGTGFGLASTFGDEIYTVAEFWKLQ